MPMFDSVEHLFHPPRPLAALGALPAGFFCVKPRGAQSETDDAGGFIHNHHAARAEQRSLSGEGIEVHADVALLRSEDWHRRSSWNHAFELVSIPDAAALGFDQFHQGNT